MTEISKKSKGKILDIREKKRNEIEEKFKYN